MYGVRLSEPETAPDETIHHVRDIDSDTPRVWAALTQTEELAGWWSTRVDTDAAGGTLS